jgi:hypothetical protein
MAPSFVLLIFVLLSFVLLSFVLLSFVLLSFLAPAMAIFESRSRLAGRAGRMNHKRIERFWRNDGLETLATQLQPK